MSDASKIKVNKVEEFSVTMIIGLTILSFDITYEISVLIWTGRNPVTVWYYLRGFQLGLNINKIF